MNQCDIYLMKFPFSDLSNQKIRPVLIISNDIYNNKFNDVVVVPLTSNLIENNYSIRRFD